MIKFNIEEVNKRKNLLEVPDNVDHVAAPEGEGALLLVDPAETVDEPLVLLVLGDELLRVLDLQQDLDALERRHDRLGDGRRDAAGQEVEHEVVVHDGDTLVAVGPSRLSQMPSKLESTGGRAKRGGSQRLVWQKFR